MLLYPSAEGFTLECPLEDILVLLGFNVVIPQKEAGILKDPPKSEPRPMGLHLEAIKAASPPVLPPAILDLSQGFLEFPKI